MLRRHLFYTLLTATISSSCVPSKEEIADVPDATPTVPDAAQNLESKCRGEILFEDNFDGTEVDGTKWDLSGETGQACGGGEFGYQRVHKEMLELHSITGGCELSALRGYTLQEGPLCLEARWKVKEREGTDFGVAVINGDGEHGSVSTYLGFGSETLICSNYTPPSPDDLVCDVDVTTWHTTRLEIDRESVLFFIDGKMTKESTRPPISDRSFFPWFGCNSSDDTEKVCVIDYLRIER